MIFFFSIFSGAKGSRARQDGRAREEAVTLAMGDGVWSKKRESKIPTA